MDFQLPPCFGKRQPEAYERLLLDAMAGDATLFARRDEVEEAWRFVDEIEARLAQGGQPAGDGRIPRRIVGTQGSRRPAAARRPQAGGGSRGSFQSSGCSVFRTEADRKPVSPPPVSPISHCRLTPHGSKIQNPRASPQRPRDTIDPTSSDQGERTPTRIVSAANPANPSPPSTPTSSARTRCPWAPSTPSCARCSSRTPACHAPR